MSVNRPSGRVVCTSALKFENAIDRIDLDEPEEERELITGLVGDVLLTVCFVQRGHRKRIISARKASQREQKDYNEANSP